MTQFNALATTLRIKTLLCCSAAGLLTACGGNIDPGGEQLSATAASVSTDAGAAATAGTNAPAAAAETIAAAAPAASAETASTASAEAAPATHADAAPAAHAEAASTAGATGQAPDAATGAFELSGYGSAPQQAEAGQQDVNANAVASIQQ